MPLPASSEIYMVLSASCGLAFCCLVNFIIIMWCSLYWPFFTFYVVIILKIYDHKRFVSSSSVPWIFLGFVLWYSQCHGRCHGWEGFFRGDLQGLVCVCEVVVVGLILIEWVILWARGLTFLMAEKEEELKNVLIKVKEESEKADFVLSIQKAKIMASSPITSWQIEGEKVEAMTNFLFLGSKITVDGDCSHEIRRHLLLGRANSMPG